MHTNITAVNKQRLSFKIFSRQMQFFQSNIIIKYFKIFLNFDICFGCHPIDLRSILQFIFSSSDNGILVAGANTSKIIQGQIHDRYTAKPLGFHEGSLIAGSVRILVTGPDSLFSGIGVVRLKSIAAVLLGWIADASQFSRRVFGQPGAHLGVGKQTRFIGVRSRSARAIGHNRRHAGNLAFGCQFPRASVSGDADDNLTTGGAVL